MTGLRIAIPNGALLEGACRLVTAAGVADLVAECFAGALLVDVSGHRFVKVRPTDVPVYVEMGACDCGIVGKDILWEVDTACYELVDLRFGGCRLVLAAPEGTDMAQGRWPKSLRVATKYPRAARRFFDGLGITAELIKLHGSVELAPVTGLVDAVLDITATGNTLRANRLVVVAEAGASTARLIVNQASLKTRFASVNALAAALRRSADAAPPIPRPQSTAGAA